MKSNTQIHSVYTQTHIFLCILRKGSCVIPSLDFGIKLKRIMEKKIYIWTGLNWLGF
jgi:hypothetical protein